MPALLLERPSTTASKSVLRSAVRPMAERGCRARMSERSGKQELAVGLLHVMARPSTTSSGKPLTRARVPGGSGGVTSSFRHPAESPPKSVAFSLTQPVWVNSTPSWVKAIQP